MNVFITAAEIIGMVTFILLSIYTFYLFLVRKNRSVKNTSLAIFLITNIFYLFGYLTGAFNDFFSYDITYLRFYGFAFGFLFGPSLYLFTESIINSDFNYNRYHLFHAVPFVFQIINLLLLDIINNSIMFIIMQGHILVYMYFCLKLLGIFENKLREFYSSVEKRNLGWLKVVVYAFIFMWLIDLTDLIFMLFLDVNYFNPYTALISVSINFIFANLLFLQSLKHPEIITGEVNGSEKSKYEYSKLDDKRKEEYLKNLELIFKTKKPYLSPNLTLDELSNISKIPARQISQIINESLNKNFYDYINGFRIEEAKKILSEHSKTKKTILEILYEVGFNSKSVFNTAFKRQTGLTPSEFKRQFNN